MPTMSNPLKGRNPLHSKRLGRLSLKKRPSAGDDSTSAEEEARAENANPQDRLSDAPASPSLLAAVEIDGGRRSAAETPTSEEEEVERNVKAWEVASKIMNIAMSVVDQPPSAEEVAQVEEAQVEEAQVEVAQVEEAQAEEAQVEEAPVAEVATPREAPPECEEELASVEFTVDTIVSPERIGPVEAPAAATPVASTPVASTPASPEPPSASDEEADEPAPTGAPEPAPEPATPAAAAAAASPPAAVSAQALVKLQLSSSVSTSNVRVALDLGALESRKSDGAAEAEAEAEEGKSPVLQGEFVKQGQHFPWTWRKRAFEVTVDEHGLPCLHYYDAAATKKGTLVLGAVRVRSSSGAKEAAAEEPAAEAMLLSDQLLLESKRKSTSGSATPAGAYEIVFEAADGQRQLVARASSLEERAQWLEATTKLLAAGSA